MLRTLPLALLLVLLAGYPSPRLEARSYSAVGMASHYAAKHHGKRTASGELVDRNTLTAAHRSLPLGSRVRVTSLRTRQSVVVRINDRGPRASGRIIDLSYKAARQLEMLHAGVALVRLELLDD
ncbi:rare lipoprotein A [Azotobacter beijerinckii]|uniref:Endolytic peptidoglycan transglycosylase RlpA n=1 Tax=Azotobacter beijerinckii TaxID=170623 RepID=A0A1H9KGN0_9GAMM|nr:septal ring lytic transglycosylase RlpA family protein [Azotobacter beijerinckii]MDV7212844.1 septal ring lytic transglycosylase RlpA family protein [Azotobacter beijerinckii]SEI37552.1 rare lipoprotein A [Azotobacter beijerinckii]SEI58561.1 rare lipoprotein A [Azotobacter beijerinckii]SEQ98219.1 rare lipoprotein A [Azotobacter beijerinckii]SFB44682.1 rare lipoprotein A [Azotobacter beijerinckii]